MRLFILAAAALAAPAAAHTKAEVSTGGEYRSGTYGTGQRIHAFSIDNRAALRSGNFQLGVQLPWHRLEAPGNVVGGGGGGLLGLPILVDPTRPPGPREVRQGLGDLRIGAGYTVAAPAGVGLTLSGEVKLPTAADGLGTGQADAVVGAELSKRVGSVTPHIAIAYTIPGDSPGLALRNSLSGRVGLAAQLGEGVRGHVGYGYAQIASALVRDEQQVSAGIDVAASRRVSIGLYGSVGLSEGSPDLGLGLRIGGRAF